MVKRYAWGTCNTDSRYPERLVNVKFHRFPSVAEEKERRKIWIRQSSVDGQMMFFTHLSQERNGEIVEMSK